MGLWKIVVPWEAHNYVLNPSAEAAGNYAALSGSTVTRSTDYAFRGVASYKIVSAGANSGLRLTLDALPNATQYIHMWIRGTLPTDWLWLTGDAAGAAPTLLGAEGDWKHYGLLISAANATTHTTLDVYQTSADTPTYYIDCVQIEVELVIDAGWTTYFDGDEPGCSWSGTRHGSRSYRPGNLRSGGHIKDVEDDYGLSVTEMAGQGSPIKEQILDPLAFVDGSIDEGIRASGRIIQLGITIKGNSLANYHSKRKAFMSAISRHLVTPQQPVTWLYAGSSKSLQIQASVSNGDEGGNVKANYEVMALNLVAAEDPYWEELAEQSATVSSSQTLAVEQMVAYRPSQPWNATTGYWDALGAPELDATPDDPYVLCFAKDKVGNLYVGGSFLNLNGIANADYIAKRAPDGTWSALGSGTGGIVRAIACDAAGNVYAAGDFTNLTDANGDYISMWNGAAWVSLGTGAQAIVRALAIGADGSVYAGGQFTSMGGVANTARIAKWNGSVWGALSTGMDGGTVYALAIDHGGNLYAGGSFTNAGGVAAADKIAKWNGTAWASLGAFDDSVYALAVSAKDHLCAGGLFHAIDSLTRMHVAAYTGSAWVSMGGGLSSDVFCLAASSTGEIYAAGGAMAVVGGGPTLYAAAWNGTSWSALPISLPGIASVQELVCDGEDLYFGFDTEGNAIISGVGAAGIVSNTATAPCYPVITISTTGATCTLQELKNESTGHVIRFNRVVQIGETITIDTRNGYESVRSDFPSPNGSEVQMLMPSDLGGFCLMPGYNRVTCYAPGAGATVTVRMRWRVKHEGFEGGAA